MTNSQDRLPPHSIEAEKGVLGCVFGAAETSLDALDAARITAEHFYDLRHRTVFEAMMRLRTRNAPVDMLTLAAELKAANILEDIGGYAALNEMQDAVPSPAHLPYYITQLAEFATRRVLLSALTRLQASVFAPGDSDAAKLAAEAGEELLAVATTGMAANAWKSMKEIVNDVISDMEENRYIRGRTQLRGLPTGPKGVYLDKLLRGIRETYYMVIAGRPGDGKTTKAMNILEYLALDYVWHEPTGNKLLNHDTNEEYPETVERKGIPIAVFSIEMDSTSLGYRLVFGRAGVDTAEYSQGFASQSDEVSLVKCAGKLSAANVWVDDSPGQTIGQIAAKARQIARKHGIKLFVLDYLQLVEIEDGKGIDRVKELTKISRTIMRLKKELKVPWIVLAQMNRNIETAEKNRTPVMSDLKDCGAIEQDADVILFLHKPSHRPKKDGKPSDEDVIDEITADWDWSKKPKRVDVVVAKNRYGPVGQAQEIFFTNLTRFEDWHLWKAKHNAEGLKKGERERLLGEDDV